jgi:hypothetical protein
VWTRLACSPSASAPSVWPTSASPAAKVMPVETRPALYRIRLGTSYYLTGPTSFLTFQNGKQGSRTFTRDVALILVKNYENAIIVPAV